MWLKNERWLKPLENKTLIDAFNLTYCFYRKRYVTMIGNVTKTVPHPYGDAVIDSHLAGSYALCVFSGDKATRFITVDIDTGGKKVVRQVVNAFVELGIPSDRIYISLSGKKGYHVDIFFEPWIYNDKAKNLYELMIWRTGLDPNKVEFAPSPTRAIKLPLGVHAKTSNRCWFVDPETLDPIKDFNYIYRIKPVDHDTISDVLREQNKKRWNELYVEMMCDESGRDNTINKEIVFNDEYYDKMRLIIPGTRHDTMVRISCDLRSYGAEEPQIVKALTGFYYRQDRSMISSSEREVLQDIEDIASWAVKQVKVTHYRPSPNEGITRHAVLNASDIESILQGSTSTSRRIALLIYSFCRIFGSSHVSYRFISDTIGCSVATVKNSINDLMKKNIISRKSGGINYRNGRLIRQSNTYFIPGSGKLSEKDNPDAFVFNNTISAEPMDDLYYGAMIHFFTPEYLKKHLTKPELRECERRLADDTEGADTES
jgi:hypothetical protein